MCFLVFPKINISLTSFVFIFKVAVVFTIYPPFGKVRPELVRHYFQTSGLVTALAWVVFGVESNSFSIHNIEDVVGFKPCMLKREILVIEDSIAQVLAARVILLPDTVPAIIVPGHNFVLRIG